MTEIPLGDLTVTISPVIWRALSATRNITTLYCHQAEAINALCEGEDVIVTTSTARYVLSVIGRHFTCS